MKEKANELFRLHKAMKKKKKIKNNIIFRTNPNYYFVA